MIVEPAPSFGAAGLFLAAQYNVDFSKDLSHSIPIEGTWQGDRKRGKSLYIDNYANNISISVASGNYSIRVPPYTSAYVDLSGFNDIVLTADSVATLSVGLSTEAKHTEMISRGNSPAVNNVAAFTYAGSYNLTVGTSGSVAGESVMAYCPDNNCIYIACKNENIVVFDCKNNKLLTVLNPDRGGFPGTAMFPKASTYSRGKVYFTYNARIVVVNCADNSYTTYTPSNGPNIGSITINEIENRIYIFYGSTIVYWMPLDFSLTPQPIFVNPTLQSGQSRAEQQIIYCAKYGQVFALGGTSTSQYVDSYVAFGNVASYGTKDYIPPTTTAANFTSICYDGNDKIYASTDSTTGLFYIIDLAAKTITGVAGTGSATVNKFSVFGPNGWLYLSVGLTVYDTRLKGIVGNMASPGANGYYGMVYASVNDTMYFLCQDGYIRWGK